MRTTPIPNPLPGPSPRIRSWRVSRASHKAPRPPKPHNLSHEPLLQDTSARSIKSLRRPTVNENSGLNRLTSFPSLKEGTTGCMFINGRRLQTRVQPSVGQPEVFELAMCPSTRRLEVFPQTS